MTVPSATQVRQQLRIARRAITNMLARPLDDHATGDLLALDQAAKLVRAVCHRATQRADRQRYASAVRQLGGDDAA